MRSMTASVNQEWHAPSNVGKLPNADAIGHGSLGSDRPFVTVYLCASTEIITSVSFETRGCGYAVAIGSVMTQLVTGESFEDCLALKQKDIVQIFGGFPPQKLYCIDLALDALFDAIDQLSDERP